MLAGFGVEGFSCDTTKSAALFSRFLLLASTLYSRVNFAIVSVKWLLSASNFEATRKPGSVPARPQPHTWGLGLGIRVHDSGYRVEGKGLRVKVEGRELRV